MTRQFTIIVTPDPEQGGYTVTVPASPGRVTEGDTIGAAIAMAREAIALHIECMIADGEQVPEETEQPRAIVISVTA